jgi:hypothetical protein
MQQFEFKDIIKTSSYQKLSDNEDYYNNVFKKTERIISAILYILSFVEGEKRQFTPYARIHHSLFVLHDEVLRSLLTKAQDAPNALFTLQHCLLQVESNIRLSTAARLIPPEVVGGVEEELDAVMRFIKNHYITRVDTSIHSHTPLSKESMSTDRITTPRSRRHRPNIPQNDLSSDAVMVYSDLNDRSVRIKTVLEATPNATIKDLSDVITDVSSKTIQRELNSLIEKGEVIRQGERRWSTYSVRK